MATAYAIKSSNKKTGPIPVTYRTLDTCPTECAFHPSKKGGCYATGRLFGLAEKHGKADSDAEILAELVRFTPPRSAIRFNVTGDVVLDDDVDFDHIEWLNDFARQRPDAKPILYSHAWRRLDPGWFDFPVNASCETVEDVRKARALGWQTVITVPYDDDPLLGTPIDDSMVVRCPAEYRTGVDCATCQLCAKDRSSTVAFTTHGASARRARSTLDELRGEA